MKKVIIIKYGELSTKKDNINYFLSCLKDNIKNALKNFNVEIKYDRGRMFIISDDDYDDILKRVKNIFGIHEINIGYEINGNDLNIIENNLIELIKDEEFTTFKVETKRSYKDYPLTSMEISKKMGGVVLKTCQNVQVDVRNPEKLIHIEIRKDKSYIYFNGVKGLGGYPVSSLGKGLLMLSGGIDSPVAGYLAQKRGVKLEAIYFESPPHTSVEALNKVKELARSLSIYQGSIKVHIINFTDIQEAIYKSIPHDYLITIMRRMMYRISERIATHNRCKILVNGESIGQVASQTLTSMSVINEVVKIPVIRPVACLDKLEIISIAKRIGTYETSILPFEDCCTIFVPEHPVINPTLDLCIEYEKLIDYEELISDAIKNRETITLKIEEDTKFDTLL